MAERPGRSCIVTGASRGLGQATALELGRRGWGVCVNFLRDEEGAARTVAMIGGQAMAVRADVRDPQAVAAMFESAAGRLGTPRLVVNNAGIARDNLLVRMTEEEWDEVMATNFRGTLNCCREAARVMRGGQIINVASASGLRGRAGQANYAASKGAVIGLTKSLAAELGPQGVRVNAVIPGYMPTGMGLAASEAAAQAVAAHVLRRWADAAEVARFIADLAELESVTGQVLSVDGRV